MAYLHQPIALNPITYSSGVSNNANPTSTNSTTSPQTQTLSVYNREYGKDRGQLPLALVSSVASGADISSFGYDDDETEDGSSIPTVRDDEDDDEENVNRMTGNVRLNSDVDVVLSGDGGGGVGYGANVRSVSTYYRMPIQSPTLPTVPTSAVANGSSRTTSILPTAQVYKSSRVENIASSSSSVNTAVVNRVETLATCYCCTHPIPTSTLKSKSYLTTTCSHHYDVTCLQHLLTHSLHTLTLPTCCGILIPTRSFLHLLPFDSPMRRAWLERELEMMAIPGERERVYCPGGGCGAFVGGVERGEGQYLNGSPRVMNCPRCERKICTRCQREAHQPTPATTTATTATTTTAVSTLPNPTSCQASTNVDTVEDREFLRVSSELGWQRCFGCRRIVQINEGCNHVLCVCGAEWCYKCGSAWRPRSCECGVFRHATG